MAHRSASNFLHASRSPACSSISARSSAFSVMCLWMVLCQVSFGRPTLLRPSGLHRNACFGILFSGLLRTWPYHLHRVTLNFSMTDGWPVLRLRSSSLTISNHLIYMIFLSHPLSNLLTHSSISFKPFQDSHPYNSTDKTMLLNSFKFVRSDILFSFQIFSMFLNAAPVLPILIPSSIRIFPSFRTLHSGYTNFSTSWMFSSSITTLSVSSILNYLHELSFPCFYS